MAELKALREADFREITSKEDQIQELCNSLDSRPGEGDHAKVESRLGVALERCRHLELQLESAKKTQQRESSLFREKINTLEHKAAGQQNEISHLRFERDASSTEVVSLRTQHAGELQVLEDSSTRHGASLASKVTSLESEKGRLTEMIEGLKAALKRVNGQLRTMGTQLEEKKAYITELIEQQQLSLQ